MYPDNRPSILPAMAQAAAMFAALGLAGLFGYAMYLEIYIIVKLVIIAAFLSYVAQLAFTTMEYANVNRTELHPIVATAAVVAYAMAIACVLAAIVIMIAG